MTRPERIEQWVRSEFAPKYVERVVDELISVATGESEGNSFCKRALEEIFPEDYRQEA